MTPFPKTYGEQLMLRFTLSSFDTITKSRNQMVPLFLTSTMNCAIFYIIYHQITSLKEQKKETSSKRLTGGNISSYPMLKTQPTETPLPIKRQIYPQLCWGRFRNIIKTQIVDLSHSTKAVSLCFVS